MEQIYKLRFDIFLHFQTYARNLKARAKFSKK